MSVPSDHVNKNEAVYLSHMKKGDTARVIGMTDVDDEGQAAMKRRLLELGFVAGETVRIVAESFPGRDPIAVRIGNTTFALRRYEASMIHVEPAAAHSATIHTP